MPGVKGQRSGGHNAKTVEQHSLEGTYRVDRHGGVTNPTPAVGAPTPPVRLTGAALQEWKRMLELLKNSEMLTVVDGAMLAGYCELHGEAVGTKRDIERLRAKLRKRLSVAEMLELQRHIIRLSGHLLRHRQQIRQYLVEFGLSPAARSRVKISAAGAGMNDTGDEMTEFDNPEPLKLAYSKA